MQGFNKMIDRKMARSPVNGLNVYPEGALQGLERFPPLSASHNLVASPQRPAFSRRCTVTRS